MTTGQEPAIVALSAPRDLGRVQDLFGRAADYLRLETGRPPEGDEARRFFADAPPGGDASRSLKLGEEAAGRLVSLADLAFGFPDAEDAFIGLLLVDPAWRGRGIGAALLAHLVRAARDRGARRLLAAVLDANRDGARFWAREGFRRVLTAPPRRYGDRIHIAHRMARAL